VAVTVAVPAEAIDALAQRAAAIVSEQDSGFLDVEGAAAYLGGCSRKRIYHLVERGQLPHHRAGGRLLFDRRELRAWVEQTS
jgi:excisionase family DNA binding protein